MICPYCYDRFGELMTRKYVVCSKSECLKEFREEIESITIPNEKVICIIKFKNWEMICEFYAISSFNTDYFCRGISKKLNRLYKIYIIPEYRKESLRKEIRRIEKKFHLRLRTVNFDALNIIDRIEFNFASFWYKTRERKNIWPHSLFYIGMGFYLSSLFILVTIRANGY